MAKKKTTTKAKGKPKAKKKKGLRNPAAIMAVPSVIESGGKAATKINKDTKNSLSILAVVGAGLGLYLVYKLVRTAAKTTDAAGNVIDGIGDAVSTDPNHGGGNVQNANSNIPAGATISGIQAETIASQLANIMGSLGRTNEKEKQQIYAILKGKTPKDYQMISAAFGLVRRNPITGEIAPPLLGQKVNLTDWLTVEMGPDGIAHLRTITNGIF